MSNIENPDKFNSYELEILEAHNSGKLDDSPLPKSMIVAAKETLKKIKISILEFLRMIWNPLRCLLQEKVCHTKL